MKSIQIILLLCIHLVDKFPSSMDKEDIDSNINSLINKGLIERDLNNVLTGYNITTSGKIVIINLYKLI